MTAKTDDQRPDHERPDDRTSEIRGQNPGQAAEDGRADEAAVAGDVDGGGVGDLGWHGLAPAKRRKNNFTAETRRAQRLISF